MNFNMQPRPCVLPTYPPSLAHPAIRCAPRSCWQCNGRSCCAHPGGRQPLRRASGRGSRCAGPASLHGSRLRPIRPRGPSRSWAAGCRMRSSLASRRRSLRTPPALAVPSRIQDRASALRRVHCRWFLEGKGHILVSI